jgi:hypothetical protein
VPHGAEWWRANDGKWYPPELRAERRPPAATLGAPPISPAARARQAIAADDPPAAVEAPARASTGASARKMAEAAEAVAAAVDDTPAVLLELRGSALTSDIDRIGDRMEISAQGVIQRGRGNKERGTLAMSEIAAVEAEKTHKGYWLRVVASDGRELVQQGLEAGAAEQARDLIREHAPAAAQAAEEAAARAAAEAEARRIERAERAAAEAAAAKAAAEKAAAEKAAAEAAAAHEAAERSAADEAADEAGDTAAPALDVPDQIRKLAELHELGILTDEEFQTKKQQLLDRM